MKTKKMFLRGRDIEGQVTAHQLARYLLTLPDQPVFVPDAYMADEPQSVGIGRVTYDESAIYLTGYFASSDVRDKDIELAEKAFRAKGTIPTLGRGFAFDPRTRA